MKTKKILVAFDQASPEAKSSDFVVPVPTESGVQLVCLRSGKTAAQGMMVFLGREITVNDVFAKLVDSGRKIGNVGQTVKMLGDYLTMLQDYKIGNVIAIEPAAAEKSGFRLVKIANSPSGATKSKE